MDSKVPLMHHDPSNLASLKRCKSIEPGPQNQILVHQILSNASTMFLSIIMKAFFSSPRVGIVLMLSKDLWRQDLSRILNKLLMFEDFTKILAMFLRQSTRILRSLIPKDAWRSQRSSFKSSILQHPKIIYRRIFFKKTSYNAFTGR